MIPLFKVHMPDTVMKPLEKILRSGYIGQGKVVEQFEVGLAKLIGNPNVLTLNSCTSALHLALRLAGVSHGDEVISTPMTCSATTEPILAHGANIVWADIIRDTGEIDPKSIESKITNKTKAIICVHWGGYPCDLDSINAIGKKHGIKVIEDAAHAMLSTYKRKYIGNHSDFVCFSFQAIKHMTTVDGGALFCKDKEDYERGKLLRWYGLDRESSACFRCEQNIQEYGYKFHMNDVNATIGLEQLNCVKDIVAKHRHNGNYYMQHIYPKYLLQYAKDRESAYWLFSILVEDVKSMQEYLKEEGIASSPVHSRNDHYKMTEEFRDDYLLGVDYFAAHQLAIPVGWWLTNSARDYIVGKVNDYS